MSEIVIQVDDLWKKYRLGVLGTGTLSHDINRWWHRVRGKPDPYTKVGEVGAGDKVDQKPNREGGSKGGINTNLDVDDLSQALLEDEMWAIRGLSFEVKRGEILGIIGRNGAGKSTLLKILSRVTAPSRGEVRVRGRIASLLEVGTGFHPELTGRENIYLNGAILGMTKAEIGRKFDEIVDFSGVEQFLDTPVKRYSSGMYVRLAFAVAAHLEPEILIVDEVLAVGDAEFQTKCLGKMQDVSAKEGRTVLFVSHNMPAVSRLTDRCLVLQKGTVAVDGATHAAVDHYMNFGRQRVSLTDDVSQAPRLSGCNQAATLLRLGFSKGKSSFMIGEDIVIQAVIRANTKIADLRFHMTVFSSDASPVGTACTRDVLQLCSGEQRQVTIRLPQPRLAPGRFYCDAVLLSGYCFEQRVEFDIVPEVLHFEVTPLMANLGTVAYWHEAWGRIALPDMCIEDSKPPAL